MRMNGFRRACVAVLSASLISLGMQAPAAAGVVGTAEAIASQDSNARAVVDADARPCGRARRARADGRRPRRQSTGRLDALSDAEVATLAGQIDEAPAGGDALAVIGIVFVVLIILELVGVIDIFKKT